MSQQLIVHTQVNEVIGGAISNVTLDVEQAGSIVLSATISTGETTVGKLQSARVNTDDEALIKEALFAMIGELHAHGVETLTVDAANSNLPIELTSITA